MLTELYLMAASLNTGFLSRSDQLQTDLQQLAAGSDGRVGICAIDLKATAPICVNGEQNFPLQSVMKLIVAAAVMDAVDRNAMHLHDLILVSPEDASPGPQEFAHLVKAKGTLRVSVEELMRQALIDSDSTSVDILIERLGGVTVVQDFLKRKKIEGVSIDRNERHLQAESVGIDWKPCYADNDKFEAAVEAAPAAKRDTAWSSYLQDPRDTATPAGMVGFLRELTAGQILSSASTQKLLSIMTATATGLDRLKAGIPQSWSLAHKTGTGRRWKGMSSATNDVGILTAPDKGQIAMAVFITASTRTDAERAGVIAKAAKLVAGAYRSK